MRLKQGFRIREVAGQYMLIPEGTGTVDFNDIFSLSESAAWLWDALQGKDFDPDMAVRILEGEYEVEHDRACEDVAAIIGKWKEYGMTDEQL